MAEGLWRRVRCGKDDSFTTNDLLHALCPQTLQTFPEAAPGRLRPGGRRRSGPRLLFDGQFQVQGPLAVGVEQAFATVGLDRTRRKCPEVLQALLTLGHIEPKPT